MKLDMEIQKLVIEHGIASESVNKSILKFGVDCYMEGFKDCRDHAALMNDSVVTTPDHDEVRRSVLKTLETYGARND